MFFINVTSAQCVPNFGSASNFALYTISGAVGNTGISSITGDMGTNTGVITGFVTPTVVNGNFYVSNSITSNASSDLISAYNQLYNSVATNTNHAPVFGLGEIITSGVYSIGAAGSVVGNLILDGQGNPNAIFIFKFGGAFTTSASSSIILTNGANPANVFWIADGAIAMAASTTMYGTLIANNGAISMGDQGSLHGRMYSTTGAVSVYGTTVTNVGVETEAVVGGIVLMDQAICIGTLPSDLILTGNTAQVLKWQKANNPTFLNPIDIVSNLAVLSGNSIGILNETTYFRAVIQNNGCVNNSAFSSTCTIAIAATTWDGISWSNGLPSDSKAAIITANFSPISNFTACTLKVSNGANFIVVSGTTVFLNGALTVDSGSSFKLKNNANLIQSSSAQNVGAILVEKTTSALNRLDYILWSSPVANQLLQAFSMSTMANRFYSYDSILNLYNTIASPSTTPFSIGSSFLIRMPNNHSITPSIWNGTFSGIPNNGSVNLTVTNNTYNAIGNPYPSGVDATMFMTQNNISEAMYFWRKTNNSNTSTYATYTLAGGVSNSGGDPLNLAPGTIIPVGQGFIVKATSTSITFNNAMRVAAINSPLLKSVNDKSRIWLDISSTNGFFGQQMIAYMNGATTGIDNAIDGRFFNDIQTAFTSIIGNEEFSIQGRTLPFNANDVVALGFKSDVATTYTISLNHFDGLFSDGQDIYLRDTTNGIITNLKTSSYTFTTLSGVFNSRFELLYQNQLSNLDQNNNPNQIIIYNQNSNLVINSGNKMMSKIKIYDITGRLLMDKENINATQFTLAMNIKNNVYVVQVTSIDNEITTKKVIN
ncbi:ice-binding family protein [Flavobacterium sp.]|uniref:ice-binding family protein n=1 Tax=Flavobacterium sp. TaxID=239 RepID=UPI003751CD32